MKKLILGLLTVVLANSLAFAGGGGGLNPPVHNPTPKAGLRCKSDSQDIRFVIMEHSITLGTSGKNGTLSGSNMIINMVEGQFDFQAGSLFRFFQNVVFFPATTVSFDTPRTGMVRLEYSTEAQKFTTQPSVTMPFTCDQQLTMWH